MGCGAGNLSLGLMLTLALAAAAGGHEPARPLPASPAARQQQNPPPPSSDDPRGRIRARVELVVVPVTVKSGSGQLVLDLQKGDFRVLEDEIEQEIELFSAEAFPLTAVLLIDNSLAQKPAEQVQKTLSAIAGGMSTSDEAAIWLFDELPGAEPEFIADNDKLFAQLKRTEIGSEFSVRAGGPMTAGPRINSIPQPGPGSLPTNTTKSARRSKHIHDAVFAAAQLLRGKPRDRRKVIFLISDGADTGNNTFTFEDAARACLSADVSVYAIGVGDVVFNRGTNVLSRYARATGGDIFYAGSRDSLTSFYSRITEQARLQYTLGYASQGTSRTKPYHDIEVRVRRQGVSVLARQGYFLPTQ
jgi:VWFA-related protein